MRTKFKKLVIETIHGLPYEEAIKKEPEWCNDENDEAYHKPVITIGRVIQALKDGNVLVGDSGCFYQEIEFDNVTIKAKWLKEVRWQLTKDNGQECTDDDQTDETIEKLIKLLEVE